MATTNGGEAVLRALFWFWFWFLFLFVPPLSPSLLVCLWRCRVSTLGRYLRVGVGVVVGVDGCGGVPVLLSTCCRYPALTKTKSELLKAV